MRSRWIGSTLVVETPAKLNLQLAVLGRRPDGFHELETVMVSVGLYDTLRFEPAEEGVQLSVSGAHGRLPADDGNLVVKAARRLQAAGSAHKGVRISLIKRIPMQAGMGGGSSDAAATLVALNAFWKLGMSSQQLHSLAASLGSDVNFFLDSTPLAICQGRGEQIDASPLRNPIWFVVARPSVGLSTAEVFRRLSLDRASRREASALLKGCSEGQLGVIGRSISNDLEAPARALAPAVGELVSRFARASQYGCGMTGSGSACYCMAGHRQHAMSMARRLRQGGVQEVFVVRTAV